MQIELFTNAGEKMLYLRITFPNGLTIIKKKYTETPKALKDELKKDKRNLLSFFNYSNETDVMENIALNPRNKTVKPNCEYWNAGTLYNTESVE